MAVGISKMKIGEKTQGTYLPRYLLHKIHPLDFIGSTTRTTSRSWPGPLVTIYIMTMAASRQPHTSVAQCHPAQPWPTKSSDAKRDETPSSPPRAAAAAPSTKLGEDNKIDEASRSTLMAEAFTRWRWQSPHQPSSDSLQPGGTKSTLYH